jgi:hypothetical protein
VKVFAFVGKLSMNRHNYYTAIIVVIFIIAIIIIILNLYYIYYNGVRVSQAANRVEPNVTRLKEAICSPILNDSFLNAPEEAKKLCRNDEFKG